MNHNIRQQSRSKILPLLRKFHQNYGKFTRQLQACNDMIVMLKASSRESRIHLNSIMIQDARFISRLMKFFELDSQSFPQWEEAQLQACMLLNMIVHINYNGYEQIFKQAVDKFSKNEELIKKLIEFITRLLPRLRNETCSYESQSSLHICIYVLCVVCIESSECCSHTILNDGVQILQEYVIDDGVSHIMKDSLELIRLKRHILKRWLQDTYTDKNNGDYDGRCWEILAENGGAMSIGAQKLVELARTTYYLCHATCLCIVKDGKQISEITKHVRKDELEAFVDCWDNIGSHDGYITLIDFFQIISCHPDEFIGYVDHLINELQFVDKINCALKYQLTKDTFDHIVMAQLMHLLGELVDSYQRNKINNNNSGCNEHHYYMSNNQDKRMIQTLLKYVARKDVSNGCRFLAAKQLCLLSSLITKKHSYNKKWLLKSGLVAILSDFVTILIQELKNVKNVYEGKKMDNKKISKHLDGNQWSRSETLTMLGIISESIKCLVDYVIALISKINSCACSNLQCFIDKDDGTKRCVARTYCKHLYYGSAIQTLMLITDQFEEYQWSSHDVYDQGNKLMKIRFHINDINKADCYNWGDWVYSGNDDHCGNNQFFWKKLFVFCASGVKKNIHQQKMKIQENYFYHLLNRLLLLNNIQSDSRYETEIIDGNVNVIVDQHASIAQLCNGNSRNDENESTSCVPVAYFIVLFELIHFIIDFGFKITKYGLKYKIPKSLMYLKNTLEMNVICRFLIDIGMFKWFELWWNVLVLKYHLRTLSLTRKFNKDCNLTTNTDIIKRIKNCSIMIAQMKNNLNHAWTNRSKLPFAFHGLMIDIIRNHCDTKRNKILNRDIQLFNSFYGCLQEKNQLKLSQFRKFKSNVSLRGRGYTYYLKSNGLIDTNTWRSNSKLLILLGLARCEGQTDMNDAREYCHRPFLLRNLCTIRECANCYSNLKKLRHVSVGNTHETLCFCSEKCKYLRLQMCRVMQY